VPEAVRASHLDRVIRMADGTVILRATADGLPLGIDPVSDYPTTRLLREPGEAMMLCTDGLLETGGHSLDTGWRRIRALLESHEGDLEELVEVRAPGYGIDVAPVRPTVRRTMLMIAQAEPERIAEGRQQLRKLLQDWASEDQRDSAVLLVRDADQRLGAHRPGRAAGRRGEGGPGRAEHARRGHRHR
jgi:hypothetical protein